MSVGLLNTCSVANKATILCEYFTEKNLDIIGITETWLKEGDDSVILELCPPDFTFAGVHRPRSKGKSGGGVGFLFKNSLSHKVILMSTYSSFEALTVSFEAVKPVCMAIIYRPPPTKKNGYTVNGFLNDLEDYASALVLQSPGQPLCIMGDFNLHLDKPNDHNVCLFNSVLSTLNLKQHISKPPPPCWPSTGSRHN